MLARKAKSQQIPEPGMLIAFPNDMRGAHSELTLTPMADARGVSPDDMLVAVKRDVLRESDLSNDDPHSLARYGLQKLRADGQLSSEEFTSLCNVCDTLFAAQRRQLDTEAAHTAVRRVYDHLLAHQASSPMALAIAGVASGALASDLGLPPAPSVPVSQPKSNLGIGLMGGLFIGGLVGLSVVGPVGGLVGCLVGALAGGVAGACIKS